MIIITGASRGIGEFLYNKFKIEEESVYGTFWSSHSNEKDSKLKSKVDVSDFDSVQNWIKGLKITKEKIILINSAGVNYNALAHKADIREWEKVIKVNLIGAFNVITTILPIMRRNEYGRIINFSSVVAQKGTPGASAYAASKSGLWGLTKSIAVENAKKGITANCINLGYFNIGMINDVPEKYLGQIKSQISTGALGHPQQIYETIKFIIENDYFNGSTLDINGCLI